MTKITYLWENFRWSDTTQRSCNIFFTIFFIAFNIFAFRLIELFHNKNYTYIQYTDGLLKLILYTFFIH